MGEYTMHILPFQSRGVRTGNAVIDGMVIITKNEEQRSEQSLVSYSSHEQVISVANEYDGQWRIQSWSQGGGSKTCKFKWLVKVGASIYQTPDLKKILAGGGPGSEKKPGYATDGIIVVFDMDKDSSSSST